jgi:hypothetical protein
MPRLTSEDHGPSSHARSKTLPTQFRLDYNSLGDGAAVPFNSVVVSALRHNNALSSDRIYVQPVVSEEMN